MTHQNIWITSKKKISKTKMFVDLQNDVTAKDIKLALKEGFQSIEHVKRYTTILEWLQIKVKLVMLML